jgi:hypothetical protein
MYKCQECNKVQPRGVKPQMVVIEKRPMEYINKLKNEQEQEYIKESSGWEIVSEKRVCTFCAKKLAT